MYYAKDGWSIVYDKAIREDGSLFFPKRLNNKFLDEQRKVLGSYIFYNQYLNEIIPDEAQEFKKSWLRYYDVLPKRRNTFAFIDPAISLGKNNDYTALTVVHVNEDNDWFVEVAKHDRITATQTVNLVFQVEELFKTQAIGIEMVSYQESLMHFLTAEMRKRNKFINVVGVKRGPDKTKEMRIRALIPRFEFGRVYLKAGLIDFEDEYFKFPKGRHDDIIDALSSIEEIAHPIAKEKEIEREPAPNHPDYERWYIKQYAKARARATTEEY